MSIFSKRRYVLVNVETKEDVYESKELLPKEVVLQDIEDDNLEEGLYRVEERVNGRKVRNTWVMRKSRRKATEEELAAKSREDAEEFIKKDAQDIKDRVEAHKKFADKVRQTYGIEGGGAVDNIKIPTNEDGKISIISAANQAIAESTYLGIRETKPAEVAATVKSVMDSGTTILAGIAQLIATRLADSNNRNKKPAEKKEVPEQEKKEPEPIKKKVEPKEVPTHKEDIGGGITKTTFGTEQNSTTSVPDSTTSTPSGEFNNSDTPITYEQYTKDMTELAKEEVEEEEPEK
ncbi:hypothetical protein KAX02_07975 [candidate division WOR-3 bacterium]|nr:hypothetical protein [candidate division WOR-3 bacterium]